MYIECNKHSRYHGIRTRGSHWEDLAGTGIWADHRNRHRVVEILLPDSSCRDLEVQFRRRAERFLGLVSASLIELDGHACLLSMIRDISGAKAAETGSRISLSTTVDRAA